MGIVVSQEKIWFQVGFHLGVQVCIHIGLESKLMEEEAEDPTREVEELAQVSHHSLDIH